MLKCRVCLHPALAVLGELFLGGEHTGQQASQYPRFLVGMCRTKESPSDEVLSRIIRALKADEREAEMLRYLAKHPETHPGLVEHVLQDKTVTFEEFSSAAGAAFRGNVRPDYSKLIERVRRFLSMEE